MIFLTYVLFFVVYFFISMAVIRVVKKWAIKRNYNAKRAGIIAGIFMYMLIFWDWIPVVVHHEYLCKTQAGFWEYKTPEEWIKENPETVGEDWGSLESYKRNRDLHKNDKFPESVQRYWYSNQVYWDFLEERHFAHAIDRQEYRLVDAKTGTLLAHSIEFIRGGTGELAPYKIWLAMGNRRCGDNRDFGYGRDFGAYKKKLVKLVRGSK